MMMHKLLFYVILIILFLVQVEGELWNITTDPLPPLQPAECGYESFNSQVYHDTEGNIVLDIQVSGYSFSSLSNQFIQAVTTGSNFGIPVYQLAFTNYTSQQGLLVAYNTQTCSYGEVEGNSPFPGYNYYQNEILSLYYSGIPIQFEYIEEPVYGLCLKYSAPVPWNNPDLPRNITYTVIFQNSTGYLISYSLIGTEYCCFGTNLYCPNSGNCSDGTIPQLTFAQTNQTLYGYQIFNASSWPTGFFSEDCPFSVVPDCSNDDDDSATEDLKRSYFLGLICVSVILGAFLLFVGYLVIIKPTFIVRLFTIPEDTKKLSMA